MYILKNALKNIGRNKGRNSLLSIIILALILSTTVALVINGTAKEIITDYKNRFGSEVKLNLDFEKLMSETKPNSNGSVAFPTAPEISPEQYLSFADSNLLKSYKMDVLAGVAFNGLEAIGDKENENNGMVASIGDSNGEYISPKAKLLAYSDTSNLPDFNNGKRTIIDGDIYKNTNECMISSEFANLNSLKVGDNLEIVDASNKQNITLKIAGIYADATKATGDLPEGTFSFENAFSNRRNEILVNLDTMNENFQINSLAITAEYELKSPDLIKDFEKELREKGLPDTYNVTTDEAAYNKIVAPVLGLSDISMTFMWIILIVGGIILLFVTSMAIRERKYEIGVIRAMGLKKAKVAMMLITETITITLICLGIGLAAGSVVSQPIADTLIESQVEASKNNQNGNSTNSAGFISISDSAPEVQPLSEIDVSLTLESTAQITMIALVLALVSSTAGVIFITKYEPMKILSERN